MYPLTPPLRVLVYPAHRLGILESLIRPSGPVSVMVSARGQYDAAVIFPGLREAVHGPISLLILRAQVFGPGGLGPRFHSTGIRDHPLRAIDLF